MTLTRSGDNPRVSPTAPNTADDTAGSRPAAMHRLGRHAALLTLVLLALIPFVQNGMIGNADEGAVLTQARIINQTGGWSMQGDVEVDPDGKWFALDLADHVGDGWYPYAKHPLFAVVVAGVGTAHLWQLYGLMTLGTVAAAVAAGLLARRISPRYGPWALWCCGIASPLLFDSYWLIAHTLGAAVAGFAVVGALRFLVDRRGDGLFVCVAGALTAALLRSEGVLFGVALSIACLALVGVGVGLGRRALLGGATLATTAMAYVGDAAWARRIEPGSAAKPFHIADEQGWLIGRLEGAWNSLLRPAVITSTGAGLSLVAAVALVVGACYLRFRPSEPRIARVAVWIGAAAAIARLAFAPSPVGGLFTAFPIMVVGLIFLPRSVLANPTARLCALVAGLHSAAVLATQYSAGGAGEWGGRFFHIVLPMLVALTVAGLDSMRQSVPPDSWRQILRAGAAITVALAVLAMLTHRGIREAPRRLVDATVAAAVASDAEAATGAAGGRTPTPTPVIMTWPAAGRFAWASVLDRSFFMVDDPADLRTIGARLCHAGHRSVVLAADPDHADQLRDLGPYRIDTRHLVDGTGWVVATLTGSC